MEKELEKLLNSFKNDDIIIDKVEEYLDQNFIRKEVLRKEIETKYGEYGKQTGSFGYQGIKMGIHSIQTEGDQMRDKLLELLK